MTDPTTCRGCQHEPHAPGTECETPVHHGPNHFHFCLCLNRLGADRSCPPQMSCQGGTLGYSDVYHLQYGRMLAGIDGQPITPDVLAAPPSVDQAALRNRVADALAEADGWVFAPGFKEGSLTYQGFLKQADAVLGVLPAPVDRAVALHAVEERLRRTAEGTFQPYYRAAFHTVAEDVRRTADETQTTQPQQTDIDTLARMLSAADVEINHGDYPTWDALAESGQGEYRKAARYLLKRLHIIARTPTAGAQQDGAQP
ncbi:hypothetical protein AB0L67_41545 [Streptomyces flaveolus]|uniref:hypothetical protein n=1 Tax=Streptomyces flaveolus TaxID=67297 RepID=UPI003432C161